MELAHKGAHKLPRCSGWLLIGCWAFEHAGCGSKKILLNCPTILLTEGQSAVPQMVLSAESCHCRVILELLTDAQAAVLDQHNATALQIFTRYVHCYVRSTALSPCCLPLSGEITQPCTHARVRFEAAHPALLNQPVALLG